MGVIKTIVGRSAPSSYLKAFSNKQVFLEGFLVFVIVCGYDFGLVPFDIRSIAMACMLRDAGNVFVIFGGGDVVGMLAHTCFEIHPCLADVFCARIAAVRE